jgi:hypothetical protein
MNLANTVLHFQGRGNIDFSELRFFHHLLHAQSHCQVAQYREILSLVLKLLFVHRWVADGLRLPEVP